MGYNLVATSVLFVCTLLHKVDSQNHLKNPKEKTREHTLLINEINADNPGEDTMEYLELYHTSGRQALLHNYSVVFYNGNGNAVYYVKHLGSLSTDGQGFLLLGSAAVIPRPKVILPKNTIQNGPDAVALYFGRTDLRVGMTVTNQGLVDALVHKSKATDNAEELVRLLTPGVEAFLEDPLFRTTDESLERCQRLDSQGFFQVGLPSPGRENHCIPFAQLNASFLLISEVSADFEFVELQGPPSAELKDLVLVFVNGSNHISFVMEVHGKTSPDGLLLIGSNQSRIPVDLVSPPNPNRPLFGANAGAVALYKGPGSIFAVGDTASTAGLLDALVYTMGEPVDTKLQDILTPGKPAFHVRTRLLQNNTSVNRCVCCNVTGDPSAYAVGKSSPRQLNDCPKERFGQDIALCFRVPDCQKEFPDKSEILMVLSLALEDQCDCGVSLAYFTGPAVACQHTELVLTARLIARSAEQLRILLQALSVTSQQRKEVALFGNWNNTMAKPCLSDVNGTEMPSEEPRMTRTTSTPKLELLLNEVNPDNPGSREDTEYIELFYPGPAPFDLRDYWLVLYNGKNNLAYQVTSLGGHCTDERGYFLVGSSGVSPQPSIVLPDNTIQNGAEAVALYYSTKPIYTVNMFVTAEGLVDAVVYTARRSDKAHKLMAILAPSQSILYENDSHSTEDESLSRCLSSRPKDQSTFQVTEITPFHENACTTATQRATEETPLNHSVAVVINEVGVANATALYQFVELKGPPGTSLKKYSLMFFSDHDPKPYASIQLRGTFGMNGLFVVLPEGPSQDGHSHAQVAMPSLWSDPSSQQKSHGVALFRHGQFLNGTAGADEIIADVVVFTWEPGTRQDQAGLIYVKTREGGRPLSLSRCSSCNETMAVSDPTPGLENRCPQQSLYLDLRLCLLTPNCSLWPQNPTVLASLQRALLSSVEESCFCRISSCYIQGLHFTCLDSILKLSGHVLARSQEHLELLAQWWANFSASPNPFSVAGRFLKVSTMCSSPNKTAPRSEVKLFQPWEIAVIFVSCISLVLMLGTVAFYYIKRQPQNYTTIEMNSRCEIMEET